MGNKPSALDAKMKAKEWQWQLKTEIKHLDKEIKKIQTDEAKLQKEIHAQASKGNVDAVQMLAKSVVRSRKAVQRLEKTKTSMHGVTLQLTTSIATMGTAHALRLSTDCMKSMNAIARVPEVSGMMDEMRREMAKCADAEDGIEEALRTEGEDEQADQEVQRILEEMALEKMGPLAALSVEPPAAEAVTAPPAPVAPQRQLVAAGGGAEPAPRPAAAAPAPAALAPPPQVVLPAVEPAPSAGYPAAPAPAPAAAASGEDDELLQRLARLKG